MIRPTGFFLALLGAAPVASAQFYMGGDVSLLTYLDSRNAVYRDNGVAMPLEQIMANNGANLFRLRIFVNPNTNYSATQGAIQDLPYTIALAQRLKASGAKILLDFHYSDTWADPGKQFKPAAWGSLSFAQLNTAVRDHTRTTLAAMRDAGVMPEMVQVGNEITNGMVWGSSVVPPDGGHVVYTGPNQNQSWMNFGSLLNSAIQGVRDVDAEAPGQRTPIAVHVDGGNVQGRAQYYYGQLTNVAGVPLSSYDVVGMSFYPANSSALTNLTGNLNYLASNYDKKVMVLENNYRWKGTATGAPWPATAAGQRDQLIAVRDLVKNLPNGRGAGVVWWYPEAIQVPNTFIFQGGAIALFDDSGGDALPALDEFQFVAPAWNVNSNGDWSTAGNWVNGIPSGAGQTARFGPGITAPRTITLDSPRTVGSISFLSGQSYSVAGTSNLTLDSTSGPAGIITLAGDHTISTPVVLNDDVELIAAFTSNLALTGQLSATGRKVSKFGSGQVQLENIRAAGLNIGFGSVKVTAKPQANDPTGSSELDALAIAVDAQLDLTNNSMLIHSPVLTEQDIRAHLSSGRITSSSADSVMRLGYGAAPAAVDSLLIKFTFAGDLNLDGVVDITDLGQLASSWQSSGVWANGDLDYNGFVDITDLGMLASNWQMGVIPIALLGLPPVSVPEPSLVLLLLGAVASLRPSRRCRKFK